MLYFIILKAFICDLVHKSEALVFILLTKKMMIFPLLKIIKMNKEKNVECWFKIIELPLLLTNLLWFYFYFIKIISLRHLFIVSVEKP